MQLRRKWPQAVKHRTGNPRKCNGAAIRRLRSASVLRRCFRDGWRLLRSCVGRRDLEMVAFVADRHLQITPGVASSLSEQDRGEAKTVPRTHGLAVTEVLLVHQAAFMRA